MPHRAISRGRRGKRRHQSCQLCAGYVLAPPHTPLPGTRTPPRATGFSVIRGSLHGDCRLRLRRVMSRNSFWRCPSLVLLCRFHRRRRERVSFAVIMYETAAALHNVIDGVTHRYILSVKAVCGHRGRRRPTQTCSSETATAYQSYWPLEKAVPVVKRRRASVCPGVIRVPSLWLQRHRPGKRLAHGLERALA